MKKQKLTIVIILIIVLIFSAFFLLLPPNFEENQRTDNTIQQKSDTKIHEDETAEPTPPFHGFHVTVQNVSESTSWDYPQNSTLEDLAGRGYEIINITPEDIEKYSYLKEGLKPGTWRGEFTRALEDEEKDDFFGKFYGKCFSYEGHNYVINMYKN